MRMSLDYCLCCREVGGSREVFPRVFDPDSASEFVKQRNRWSPGWYIVRRQLVTDPDTYATPVTGKQTA